MSRSDAKRRREPGTARGKHPLLHHSLHLTWQEKPGQLSWAGTGTRIPGRAGGRVDRAPEHTCLGWGEGQCTSMPEEKAKRSRIIPPPNN